MQGAEVSVESSSNVSEVDSADPWDAESEPYLLLFMLLPTPGGRSVWCRQV